MRFLFCVENATDAAVFEALLTKLFATTIEAAPFAHRREGWNSTLALAPIIARKVHRDGLDGALFAIDNDGAEPVHSAAHEGAPSETCRTCLLKASAKIEEPLSWPRPELPRIQYLFAVPIQTLETWLLHAKGHDFKGAEEHLGRDGTGRRTLKKLLYGVEQTTSQTMIEVARPLATALDPDALALKSASFAHLLTQVRKPNPGIG